MNNNFNKFMDHIYLREGYYSNHAWDAGGETLFGISRIYNSKWIGWKIWDSISVGGVPPKEKALLLLDEHVKKLYKDNYWDAVRADELPSGIDLFAADCCVNPGENFAKIALQQSSGAFPDGIIGPKTLNRVRSTKPKKLLASLHDKRSVYYAMNSNPRVRDKAIGGWVRRNREVYEESLDLI